MDVILKVEGMHCGGCVKNITGLLQALPGVAQAEVSLAAGQARVVYDPALTSPQALCTAIENAGFDAAVS